MNESADSFRRCLLLAGSAGPERVPARPDPENSRWFEPLHVREETSSRERIAEQVLVGADVVVAPTWLTHRRALMPLGETRRARAWTQAAIRLSREAVEIGLERREAAREEALDAAGDGGSPVSAERPTPLVAAVLPALDEVPEPGTGRLLPRESAGERDYRDQAGLIADGEPDAILIEGQGSAAESALALDAAVDTGLPTWVSAPADVAASNDDGMLLARWTQATQLGGATRLLLSPPVPRSARVADDARVPWGGLMELPASDPEGDSDMVRAWLEAGASAIGILDGANGLAISRVRTAIDDLQQSSFDAEGKIRDRWEAHVARVARMAAGGPALWLGTASPGPLPEGFDWLIVDSAEWRRLPIAHYRLIVQAGGDPGPVVGPATLGQLLEDRGLLASVAGSAGADSGDMRLLSLDTELVPALAIYRREA